MLILLILVSLAFGSTFPVPCAAERHEGWFALDEQGIAFICLGEDGARVWRRSGVLLADPAWWFAANHGKGDGHLLLERRGLDRVWCDPSEDTGRDVLFTVWGATGEVTSTDRSLGSCRGELGELGESGVAWVSFVGGQGRLALPGGRWSVVEPGGRILGAGVTDDGAPGFYFEGSERTRTAIWTGDEWEEQSADGEPAIGAASILWFEGDQVRMRSQLVESEIGALAGTGKRTDASRLDLVPVQGAPHLILAEWIDKPERLEAPRTELWLFRRQGPNWKRVHVERLESHVDLRGAVVAGEEICVHLQGFVEDMRAFELRCGSLPMRARRGSVP